MKLHILFVDDEVRVLDGLRRLLRPMHTEWDMAFESDPKAAVARLAKEPFDVVVSDMQMPGMDGAELLAQVEKLRPEAVRIILSGFSNREAVLRSVGPTHQYLSKPCDPEVLKRVIFRAKTLRERLLSPSLRQLVTQIKSLPVAPEVYAEIQQALHLPSTSLQTIGELISRDVAMSAKILQMVNSAYFGLSRTISSVPQAVSLLGLDTIVALILSANLFSGSQPTTLGFSTQALREHSLKVALAARAIARQELPTDKAIQDASFVAGMLHDLGRLVLAVGIPERYGLVIEMARANKVSLAEMELRMLQTTHAEAGAYLATLWGLPDGVVEPIAFHERPEDAPGTSFEPLTAVAVANVYANGALPEDSPSLMAHLNARNLAGHTAGWKTTCLKVMERNA